MTIAEDEIQIIHHRYTGTTWFFLFCLVLGGISLAGAIYEDLTTPPTEEAPIEEAPIDTNAEDEAVLLLLLLSAPS